MAAIMDGKVKKSGSTRHANQPPPSFGVPYTIVDVHSDEPIKRAETDYFRIKSSVATEIEGAIRSAQETQVPLKVYTSLPCAMWTDPDKIEGEFWVLSTNPVGFSVSCKNHEKDRIVRWKKSGVPNDFVCQIPDTQCLAQIGVGYAVTNNEKLFTCRVVGLYVQGTALQPKYPLWFVQVRRSTTTVRRATKASSAQKQYSSLFTTPSRQISGIPPSSMECTSDKGYLRLIAATEKGVQFGVSIYSSSNPDFFHTTSAFTGTPATPRDQHGDTNYSTLSEEDASETGLYDVPAHSRKSSRRSNSTPSSAMRNTRRFASPRPLSSGSLGLQSYNQQQPLSIQTPCHQMAPIIFQQSPSNTPSSIHPVDSDSSNTQYTPSRNIAVSSASRKSRRTEQPESTSRLSSPVTVPRVQRVMDWESNTPTDDWASNILRKASKVSEGIISTPRSRFRPLTSPASPSMLNPSSATSVYYGDTESRDTPNSMEGTYYSKSRSVSSSRMVYASVRRRNSKVRTESRGPVMENNPHSIQVPPVLITPYAKKGQISPGKQMPTKIPDMDQSLFEDQHDGLMCSSQGQDMQKLDNSRSILDPNSQNSFKSTKLCETGLFDLSTFRLQTDSNHILSDVLYDSDDDAKTRDTLWSPVRIVNSRDHTPGVPYEDMAVGNLANQLANTGVKSVTPSTPQETTNPISFPMSEFDASKLHLMANNTLDTNQITFAPIGQRNMPSTRGFSLGFHRTNIRAMHESPITKNKRIGEKSAFSVASKRVFSPLIISDTTGNNKSDGIETPSRQSTLAIPPAGVIVSPTVVAIASHVPVPPLPQERKEPLSGLISHPLSTCLNEHCSNERMVDFSMESNNTKAQTSTVFSNVQTSVNALKGSNNLSLFSSISSHLARSQDPTPVDKLDEIPRSSSTINQLNESSTSILSLCDEFNDSDYDLSSITGMLPDGPSMNNSFGYEDPHVQDKISSVSSKLKEVIDLPKVVETSSFLRAQNPELAILNPSSGLQNRSVIGSESKPYHYSLSKSPFDATFTNQVIRVRETLGSPVSRVPSRLLLPTVGPGTLSPIVSTLDRSSHSLLSLDDTSDNDEELEDALRCTPSRSRTGTISASPSVVSRDVRHILGDGYD